MARTSAAQQQVELLAKLVMLAEVFWPAMLDEQTETTEELKKQTSLLQQIADGLAPLLATPTQITFQETTMLPPVAGNTLVYTGTLTPSGSAFPAGTTFTVTSTDPNVTATVDSTGLIVTVVLGPQFAAGENDTIDWATSTYTPVPDTSPASLTATINITGVAPPTATPTGVTFVQTT